MRVITKLLSYFDFQTLSKSDNLLIIDQDKVRFKCTKCSGQTDYLKDGATTETKHVLFCNSCGSKGEYFVIGTRKRTGVLSNREEFKFYKTSGEETKLIGLLIQ